MGCNGCNRPCIPICRPIIFFFLFYLLHDVLGTIKRIDYIFVIHSAIGMGIVCAVLCSLGPITVCLCSGRRVAQGPRKKYKQSQHDGVKGEESPPPTTVRTHFRLGLHVKSHSPGVVGGGEEFIVLAWGNGFCVIKSLCSYKCLCLFDQVSP